MNMEICINLIVKINKAESVIIYIGVFVKYIVLFLQI